jgi:Tfp pilus assembly protein FimT
MIITVAILGVLVGLSVFGIRSARAALRLQNSARSFAQIMEKARLDAIRRRVTTHAEFTGANTYEISMDFAGNGTTQTRSFTLDTNVNVTDASGQPLASDSYPYADFDWRGRTAECNMLFNMMNERGDAVTVQVAGSGDITVNRTAVTTLPTITYTNVNSTSDIATTTVLNGNNTPLNLAPCGSGGVGVTSGGGSVPPPVVTCTTGTMTLSSGYVTVHRNGGSTQSINVTVTMAGTVTVTPDSNLSVTPASRTVSSSSGGTVSFTIASVTKSRGTYPVKFNFSTCTPATLYVKVVN